MNLISVIIVNYNTPELTVDSIRSIFYYTKDVDYEIILVDNGSHIDSKKYFEKYLQGIAKLQIIYSSENLGFGWGNNLWYAHSKWEYLFFLNSDTLLFENTLLILLNHYIKRAKTMKLWFLSPRLYLDKERTKIQHICNEVPTISKTFIALLPLCNFLFSQIYRKFVYSNWDRNSNKEVWSICGAAMFTTKLIFDQIGWFDTRFFLYMEEFDLAKRVEYIGFTNYYTVDTSIIHLENQSPKIRRKKILISYTSFIKFILKYI